MTRFRNLSRSGDTKAATLELEAAGIPVAASTEPVGDCDVKVTGALGGWVFERAWTYWIARRSRGDLTNDEAQRFAAKLHGQARAQAYGRRADVSVFHVDTADGLASFAQVLRSGV